ncbi:hypothetical protein ERJ75_001103500 [Trypanosoma vivax]|nr:hypothetical protein ERJ75_001103500 [Trypanosoma vivax]
MLSRDRVQGRLRCGVFGKAAGLVDRGACVDECLFPWDFSRCVCAVCHELDALLVASRLALLSECVRDVWYVRACCVPAVFVPSMALRCAMLARIEPCVARPRMWQCSIFECSPRRDGVCLSVTAE